MTGSSNISDSVLDFFTIVYFSIECLDVGKGANTLKKQVQ